MKDILTSLRPRQWVKNLFVFLPLIFGKKIFAFPEDVEVLFAFLIFSATSSAVYLVNDVSDLKEDRAHKKKRLRPIAAGKVSVRTALTLAVLLGGLSLVSAFLLNPLLGWLEISYILLNLAYSRFLKHKVLIDVGCIAIFFLLRVAAGSVVAGVEMSHWILFMTALLALFLGFNKRRQELHLQKGGGTERRVLANYDGYFIDQMVSVVTASIVVVYMLYTVDAQTVANLGTEHLSYTVPFVYYGIFRYLFLVHKANVDGDPTTALLSDRQMLLNIGLWIATCVSVIYFGL